MEACGVSPDEHLRRAIVDLYPQSLQIPTKPAMHSNLKPATYSDAKPASVPI